MLGPDRSSKKMKKNGFTLIELLVAMAIASVLMAGIVQMFRSNRIAFDLMKQLQLVEENGRVGIDFISSDIASAYFPSTDNANSSGPMQVYDNAVAPTDENNIRSNLSVKAGTDVIELFTTKCLEPITLPSLNENSANTGMFNESSLTGCMDCYYSGMPTAEFKTCVEQYSILLRGDAPPTTVNGKCTYNLTSGSNPTGPKIQLGYNRGNNDVARNMPHTCSNLFTPGNNLPGIGIIGELTYYYVRSDDPNNTSGTPNPQLMSYVFGGAPEVIANYVEDFQALIGEDNDQDGKIDTWSNGIINPADIKAVKISMMLKTPNIDPGKQPQTPKQFANLTILENSTISNLNTSDLNRRRLVTRTIRLRNMQD